MSRHVPAIVLGVVLLIAAAAGFIIVPEHAPIAAVHLTAFVCGAHDPSCNHPAEGLSHVLYDVLRVGTWACLIVGLVVMILALISYSRSPRSEAAR